MAEPPKSVRATHKMAVRVTAFALSGIVEIASAAEPAGDPAYGEYLSSACISCHRLDGADKGIPSIIGWPTDQFVAVLKSYKDKHRDNQVMQAITERLSEDEMAALAAYYASIKPK
ncbi:MAG: c-type cytochrome [Hyphomicrobiaceae bacterium]